MLGEIHVSDPAADMAGQIDPAFPQARGAVIGRTAGQPLSHTALYLAPD